MKELRPANANIPALPPLFFCFTSSLFTACQKGTVAEDKAGQYNTFMPDAPRKDSQPMDKTLQNIQDAFLNHVRKERLAVTILLMGGTKLSGKIKSFDKYALVVESNGQEQLIFKHAIASVAISRPASAASSAAQVAEA